ncbi:NTP transferase domain-containing protein [bacterium]|nr:NTP transferase domain-containing protein [bacterium]
MALQTVGVIMAGGSGERFWPVSRKLRPKQLLHLTSDDKIMLQEAVDRLAPVLSPERILIATSLDLLQPIRDALPNHPPENIIGEPMRRNTSGCIAFAAAHAKARFLDGGDDLLMSVTTADHLIGDEERFCDTIKAALRFAEQEDALLTIGTHPTRPETGYGYIEISELNKPITDEDGIPIYRVSRFLEKPNLDDAERYQASRFYYWNSGMFFWRLSTFTNSLQKAMPELSNSIDSMAAILKEGGSDADKKLNAVFEALPNISIDYGLMEKAENVFVTLGDFRWDDLGSWDALSRIRRRDDKRNTAVGNPILVDCENVIAYNEPGGEEMAVCVVGMKDAIVVTTHDAVLVCPNDRAQDVKKAVALLKESNASQL